MKRFMKVFVCLIAFATFVQSSQEAFASRYSRSKARNVINKTAYVIDQAYDVAYFYNYWNSTYLSRAVYYNDYAQRLYNHRSYRSAIRYSLRAREYALYILDNCDDYWEFFYYTYYGWSHLYGYNPHFAYANGYRDGYYDGYYAAYCDRHHHDYRHDPHYRPHGNYHNRPNHPQGGGSDNPTVIGRGNTGTVTSGGGTQGGGTITRPGFVPSTEKQPTAYKNFNFDEYFSDDERKLLDDIPNEEQLDRDFKTENPHVTFNDASLSTNKAVLERNKEKAQDFSKDAKDKTIRSVSIERPTQITTAKKPTKETPTQKPTLSKPTNKQINQNGVTPVIPAQKPTINNNTTERKPTVERNTTPIRNTNVGNTRQDKKVESSKTTPTKSNVGNSSSSKKSSSNVSSKSSSSKSSSVKKSSSSSKSNSKVSSKKSESKSSSKKLQRR